MGCGATIGTVGGAAAGFVIGGPVGAAAGAAIGGGIGGGIDAGNDAADAQGKIAQAQQKRAEQAMAFAAPTQAELDNLQKQINNYQMFSGRSQAQLDQLGKQLQDSYGSNILEQGKQLHEQLTGGSSEIYTAAQANIQRQRKQLEDQLVQQMGPAALTSSAGQQALQNFDFQANQQLVQVKQGAINNLIQGMSGLQGSQSQSLNGILQINSQLTGMLNNIQQTQGGFQSRQVQAALGTAQYQGSEYVKQLQDAKNSQQTFGQIANLGGQIAGAAIGSSAKSPSGGTSGGFQAPSGAGAADWNSGSALGGFGRGSNSFTDSSGMNFGDLNS